MEKLKACPFCGNKNAVLLPSEEWYYVYCSLCHAQSCGRRTPEDAAITWNIRCIDEEAQHDCSSLPIRDCVENGAGTCRNELLIESLQKSCTSYRNKALILSLELENLRNLLGGTGEKPISG